MLIANTAISANNAITTQTYFVSQRNARMLKTLGARRFGGAVHSVPAFSIGGYMSIDLLKVAEACLSPAILGAGAVIAKCLKEIATELYGIKTAMAVTTNRVDAHDEVLLIHDGRIRTLETRR